MKQSDFSFNEAKKVASFLLGQIAVIAENLNDNVPVFPLQWATELRFLEMKVKNSNCGCLSSKEIKTVWEFAQCLIIMSPDIEPQLRKFWELYAEIFNILASKKDSDGYSLRKFIIQLDSRIKRSDKLEEEMVLATKEYDFCKLSPMAMLLVHVIRTETIEHVLVKQINDAIFTHNLQNKFDAESICSVEGKVQKNEKWEPDGRAIRNAIAHGHFKLLFSKKDWEIEFDNQEHGYSYFRKFSSKEFTKFFDLKTMLFKFQMYLLLIIELLPILSTHFSKCY